LPEELYDLATEKGKIIFSNF